MLEPRSASGTSPSSLAIVATSSSTRPSSAPGLAPCPRWSKHTAAGRAGEVVVGLLARAGAVEDHHAAPRIALRQPQGVGQAVGLAELGRGSGGLIAHNRRASWPPRR